MLSGGAIPLIAKLVYAELPDNEPGLRNSFTDTAQGLRGNADIGSEVFAGNKPDQVGVVRQEAEIALFGRIFQERHLPLVLLYIQFFCCQSSQCIARYRTPVEFLQVIPGDTPDDGIRQCLRIIPHGCPGEKRIVGCGKAVLEGDFEGDLFFFFPDKEPDDPAIDKGDIIFYVTGGEDQFLLLKCPLLKFGKE